MAVAMINAKITELNWDQVMQTPRGQVVPVCKATEAEWNAYLGDDWQVLKSTHMEWIDGEIVTVELPSREHGQFRLALDDAVRSDRIVKTYLKAHGRSYNEHLRRYQSDLSYGPSSHAGGALPVGMDWVNLDTLKVEVGFTRHWGDEPGQLDWKANVGMDWANLDTLKVEVGFTGHWGDEPGQLDWKVNEWAAFPGVAYVLCVAANASYKLYRVGHHGHRLPVQAPRPVAAPNSNAAFDSRLLLGLQPGEALPDQFPDPLVVDLREVLEDARGELPPPV